MRRSWEDAGVDGRKWPPSEAQGFTRKRRGVKELVSWNIALQRQVRQGEPKARALSTVLRVPMLYRSRLKRILAAFWNLSNLVCCSLQGHSDRGKESHQSYPQARGYHHWETIWMTLQPFPRKQHVHLDGYRGSTSYLGGQGWRSHLPNTVACPSGKGSEATRLSLTQVVSRCHFWQVSWFFWQADGGNSKKAAQGWSGLDQPVSTQQQVQSMKLPGSTLPKVYVPTEVKWTPPISGRQGG